MRVLKINYDHTDFCELSFPYNRRFSDLVRYGIKPPSYRKYSSTTQKWSVHVTKIPMIVAWGRRSFDHVDYSQLPQAMQVLIVQYETKREVSGAVRVRDKRTPHQVLHLLPSAPAEVVKAAYKAMASLTHPDRGGSPEMFRLVQESYESIVGKDLK